MSDQTNTLSEKEFKKDYVSYLLGVLVPAIINFLTIPFFKNLLGASQFGVYSFYFSILLIVNTSFSGGITQSIIRLHVDYNNNKLFFIHSIWLSVLLQAALMLPFFIYIQTSLHIISVSLLFILSLFFANLYTTLLAVTQANRLSKLSAIAETIRTILLLGISIILLNFFPGVYFLNAIFFAIACSYTIAAAFLFKFNRFSFTELFSHFDLPQIKNIGVEISKYGGFLIGWYFFSFGISLTNRFVLAHFLGKNNIGNFTASFDILNKSITVVLAPVVVSLFPLLVKANIQGNDTAVSKFIKKITVIETGIMALTIGLFMFFGFKILSLILKTPATSTYLFLDVQVIIGSFIWQMAMLQHKILELGKKTGYMLLFVAIGFISCLCTDIYLIGKYGITYASTGFLVGGLVYIGCIVYYNSRHRMIGLFGLTGKLSS